MKLVALSALVCLAAAACSKKTPLPEPATPSTTEPARAPDAIAAPAPDTKTAQADAAPTPAPDAKAAAADAAPAPADAKPAPADAAAPAPTHSAIPETELEMAFLKFRKDGTPPTVTGDPWAELINPAWGVYVQIDKGVDLPKGADGKPLALPNNAWVAADAIAKAPDGDPVALAVKVPIAGLITAGAVEQMSCDDALYLCHIAVGAVATDFAFARDASGTVKLVGIEESPFPAPGMSDSQAAAGSFEDALATKVPKQQARDFADLRFSLPMSLRYEVNGKPVACFLAAADIADTRRAFTVKCDPIPDWKCAPDSYFGIKDSHAAPALWRDDGCYGVVPGPAGGLYHYATCPKDKAGLDDLSKADKVLDADGVVPGEGEHAKVTAKLVDRKLDGTCTRSSDAGMSKHVEWEECASPAVGYLSAASSFTEMDKPKCHDASALKSLEWPGE